jgi:formylglycine-generating enzyme required for sulfatase activity
MSRRKKTFPCGHKGYGQTCPRCEKERKILQKKRQQKQEWESTFAEDPIDLKDLPVHVVVKARAIIAGLQSHNNYREFGGKRLRHNRWIISIPVTRNYRMICHDQGSLLVPHAVLPHEDYSRLEPHAVLPHEDYSRLEPHAVLPHEDYSRLEPHTVLPHEDYSRLEPHTVLPHEDYNVDKPLETQQRKPKIIKIIIKRHQGEAQFFVEQLSDKVGIQMMLIPEGSFNMGSPEDEQERSAREEPVHLVNVPSFFIGKYPVTQAQWKIVASLPQVNRELKPNPSFFKGDNRPVESVSWYDAVEFCQRLSQRTNRTYRLPTEAESEYACRAGTTTPFHFGETITTDLANYRGTDNKEYGWSGSYGREPKGEYRKETTAVDHFVIANAFGLCDMHGNVYEWCLDHWHDNYQGALNDGSAWLTDDEDAFRVLRGGSWKDVPGNCRSASRFGSIPDHVSNAIGFRVVCEFPRILQ